MNRRAQTNHQLYQARLMLDLASNTDKALGNAALDAGILFLYRSLCSGLTEVGEQYGLQLRADDALSLLLDQLGEHRPDGWEYRSVSEALRTPGHWMAQLRREAERWTQDSAAAPVKPEGATLIATVSDDNEDHTNHYRSWLDELQQWINEIRALSDYS